MTNGEKSQLNQAIRQFKVKRNLTNRINQRLLQVFYAQQIRIAVEDIQTEMFVEWIQMGESLGFLRPIKKSGERKTRQGVVYYEDYFLTEIQLKSKYDIDAFFKKADARMQNGLTYYLKDQGSFDEDLPLLRELDQQFRLHASSLTDILTINQRSYQFFKNEKILSGKQSAKWSEKERHWLKVIQRLGLSGSPDSLNYIELQSFPQTLELNRVEGPGVVLILENQDPFQTLIEEFVSRDHSQLRPFDGLMFGSGNTVESLFYYIHNQTFQGVLGHPETQFYYAGDLDVEGIRIFKRLQSRYPKHRIHYLPGYFDELQKAARLSGWRTNTQRKMSEDEQAQWWKEHQETHFLGEHATFVLAQLEQRLMIPQEVMTKLHWQALIKELQLKGVCHSNEY